MGAYPSQILEVYLCVPATDFEASDRIEKHSNNIYIYIHTYITLELAGIP